MNITSWRLVFLLITFAIVAGLTPAPAATAAHPGTAPPQNIILMIGDGMGFEHLKAASIFAHGQAGKLSIENLPQQASMTTASADNAVTESAAATTAIATGFKVNNEVLNLAIPGNGAHLQTVLEYYQDHCKSTGIVTTNEIIDATPAAFVAHTKSRYNVTDVISAYLQYTRPDVIFGGGHKDLSLSDAITAGYTVVNNRDQLDTIDSSTVTKLLGIFEKGDNNYEYDYAIGHTQHFDTMPHLSESTAAALKFLKQDPNGFFLMIESGRIDHGSHNNKLPHTIYEMLEFDQSVRIVTEWIKTHPNTLLIVTSDHETGGLQVLANNGKDKLPDVAWQEHGHTPQAVPVFAMGPNSEHITGSIDNTDLFDVMTMNTANISCTQTAGGIANQSFGYIILILTFLVIIPATLTYFIRRIRRLTPRQPLS